MSLPYAFHWPELATGSAWPKSDWEVSPPPCPRRREEGAIEHWYCPPRLAPEYWRVVGSWRSGAWAQVRKVLEPDLLNWVIFAFEARPHGIWRFPGSGLNQSCSCRPMPQPQHPGHPSCVCDLHHSSQQCQDPNSLSKARDWTHILIDPSWVHSRWATMGTPNKVILN